jgi:hypothetical protein
VVEEGEGKKKKKAKKAKVSALDNSVTAAPLCNTTAVTLKHSELCDTATIRW